MYNCLYQGESDEAKKKFPFLIEGIYLHVQRSFSKNIGIFPNKNSFYVVTYQTESRGSFYATVEETNSIELLNTIIKRETFEGQYLSETQVIKVKEFLKENNCIFID